MMNVRVQRLLFLLLCKWYKKENKNNREMPQGQYTHIFLVIRDTDELVAYVYDYNENLIHTSTTTIDSSVFGHDFNRNLFNGRTERPSGPGRKNVTQDAGWWQEELTVAQMEAHVALNPN
jgi:hypothetical protein